MSLTPISGYTSSSTTDNGTTYFYTGSDAAKVVSTALANMEAAMAQQKQSQVNDAVNNALEKHGSSDIVITAAAIGTAASIATIVGAAATVAGTVAATASAATGIAGLALSSSDPGTEALEIVTGNNTFAPVVCYKFSTTGCSNASMFPPLLPGESGAMSVISGTKDGKHGFQGDNDSIIDLRFLVGEGFYTPEGSSSLAEITGIKARIAFYYNSEKVWYPKFYIDGTSSPMDDDDIDGLTAVCFIPNDDSNVLGFTVSSNLVEKASAELNIMFLPVASAIS